MTDAQYEDLAERLDVVAGLLLCALLKDEGTEPRDVMVGLRRAGVQPARIAELLDVTPNAVRVATHRARKKAPRKRQKRAK